MTWRDVYKRLTQTVGRTLQMTSVVWRLIARSQRALNFIARRVVGGKPSFELDRRPTYASVRAASDRFSPSSFGLGALVARQPRLQQPSELLSMFCRPPYILPFPTSASHFPYYVTRFTISAGRTTSFSQTADVSDLYFKVKCLKFRRIVVIPKRLDVYDRIHF